MTYGCIGHAVPWVYCIHSVPGESVRVFTRAFAGVFFACSVIAVSCSRLRVNSFTFSQGQAMPKEKTFFINNRRYLGNKFKLLPFIKTIVENECRDVKTVADIFAGTGSVASAFLDKDLVVNDFLYSNHICHIAWFSPQRFSRKKVKSIIRKYNELSEFPDNYMSHNFGNTFFSIDDCRKIGFIREDIEIQYHDKQINEKERALLITSLLYAMDKIANTCGHYDAYRKGVSYDKHLEMLVPAFTKKLSRRNSCYNIDTNELVRKIEADLVYVDPPYNSRQYCDAYHILENVARWEKPEVSGIARKMDRSNLKSDYCTKNATTAFENLVENIHAKYILLSYNNMAEKGNDRSNAKISDSDILRILGKKGEVKVFSEEYKAFSAGKSDISDNEERLFLCICHPSKELIPSALNYTGGKFKLLSQLLPLFPRKIDVALDLFCGGCNVGININCKKVILNDKCELLVGLLKTLRENSIDVVFEQIFKIIDCYNLSLVSKNGYDFYACNSQQGLAKYNRSGFNDLKKSFNNNKKRDTYFFLQLFVLIVYAFNNQVRFNAKGEFNLPVGKRDFNKKMQMKLKSFMERLQSGNYEFQSVDFSSVSLDELTEESFVYADPPYLISCASYNEQNGWNEEQETLLLALLNKVNEKNVKFALSNVLEHKGLHNLVLEKWLLEHPEYAVIDLNKDYSNSNYHAKNTNKKTREVLIVNYEV